MLRGGPVVVSGPGNPYKASSQRLPAPSPSVATTPVTSTRRYCPSSGRFSLTRIGRLADTARMRAVWSSRSTSRVVKGIECSLAGGEGNSEHRAHDEDRYHELNGRETLLAPVGSRCLSLRCHRPVLRARALPRIRRPIGCKS